MPSLPDDKADFLREGLRILVQAFIELDIASMIDATPHQRSTNRRSYRNGYRRRAWSTTFGELDIEIPKLRKGTYYPTFLDALRQSEPILVETLQKIYDFGVTNRDAEAVFHHIGFRAIAPDQVAELVEQLYDLVDRFREKPQMPYPKNLRYYRPVNAVSTRLVTTDEQETVSRIHSIYMGSLAFGQVDDWLTESLDTLIRVHQALADQTDAVALEEPAY